MMICGTALAARRAMRAHAAAAAGPTAALLVWFLHASIDWDWQLPAVSLPAIALAGALIVLAEQPLTGAGALRGSSRRCSASDRPALSGASTIRTRHAVTLSGSRLTHVLD